MPFAFPLPPSPPLHRLRAVRVPAAQVPVEDLVRCGLTAHVKKGSRVALLVGSRGIAELPRIVKASVDALYTHDCTPFIVPAMGSHGGATAEGQAALLAGLGISEATMGAPIRSSMAVRAVGAMTTPRGRTLEIVVDERAATCADAVIPIARIKPHTGFRGAVESGIAKMLVIGLGKHEGASRIHQEPYEDFAAILARASELVCAAFPVTCAIAIVENAFEEVASLSVVAARDFAAQEPVLLEDARRLSARIGLSPIDVCIVERIGKNISGTGLDPNVLGRAPGILVPRIERIVVLGLTVETKGNGNGLGLADITTMRVRRTLDETVTTTNVLASRNLHSGKTPIALATDDEAIGAAIHCVQQNTGLPRVVRIASTLELGTIAVSEALLAEALASGLWRHDGPLRGWIGPLPAEAP